MSQEKLIPFEEEEIRDRLDQILSDPQYRDNPLRDELRYFAEKYIKLSRKLEKITRISDRFQVQLRELNEAFQKASLTDPLTDLPNRRYIQVRLEAEISRCARSGSSFGLIMVDIDRFKHINDCYGHLAGDQALQEITDIIRGNLRRQDICARWGGEEFLIYLSEVDDKAAFDTAERLRQMVASHSIHHGDNIFHVTVSLGVCSYQANQTIEECIEDADQALYAAKKERNCSIMLGHPK